MRRRNQLRPDTFPFLAVLLCTMGSLILVLMILDRRSRLVARARAEQAWARAEKEEAEQAARLRQQQEEYRLARLENHHREQARLTTQEQELRAEYERVRSRLEATLRSLHEGEREEAGLARRRADAQKQLEQVRQGLAGRKEQLSQAARRSGETHSERERLVADLLRLEEALARLREQRQREQRTWSVVPYVGRRGRNSRPFYVECTATGLIFHPDHLTLDGSALGVQTVVDEVKKRNEQRRRATSAGDPAAQPYWLLLVRPEGIVSYYVALAALKALDVEYGYEFVDADWVLDFPDPATAPKPSEQTSDLPRPQMHPIGVPHSSDRPPATAVLAPPVARVPLRVAGTQGRGEGVFSPPTASSPLLPTSGDTGSAPPAVGVRGGFPPADGANRGSPPPAIAATGEGNRQTSGVGTASSSALGAGEGRVSAGERLAPPSPFASTAAPGTRGGPQGSGAEARTEPGNEVPVPPRPQQGSPSETGEAGAAAPQSAVAGGPPGQATRTMPTLVGGPPGPPGSGGDGPSDPLAGPGGPGGGPRKGPKPPLRPAPRPGAGEWVIVVECDAQGVRLSPSRLTIPLPDLTRGRGGDVLLAHTIRDMLAQRQAAGRPGDTFHPVIRFVVHHDGLRAFHLAYPTLNSIPVEKRTAMDGE